MFASSLNPAQVHFKSNCTDAGLQRSIPCPTGYQFYDGICIFVRNSCEITPLGSSINDITVLGGRGYQGFCDNSTKAL